MQDDPALEQLRQEVQKRTRLAVGWVFCAPIIFVIVISQLGGK
jgi:hypothetical protein